ncbi:MAG: methyltransferase domain-containing protein [Proteobacteria bacterium]|nr:methyltransferase domain-containing protein [Pseudomonadota bacterium]
MANIYQLDAAFDGLAPAPACPCCNGKTSLFGTKEFNITGNDYFCGERQFTDSGIQVPYYTCNTCSYLFTNAMDSWSDEDFKNLIYNNEYIKTDPPFTYDRPKGNAEMLAHLFGATRNVLTVLDYGGGNGLLAKMLKGKGFCAKSYDPFHDNPNIQKGKRYHLVTAFEVVEHVPDQKKLFKDMLGYIGDTGVLFFSTLLQNDDFAQDGMNWWYICPRNGHVGFHTEASLKTLAASLGYKYHNLTGELHMICKQVPGYARHLLEEKEQLPCPNSPKSRRFDAA